SDLDDGDRPLERDDPVCRDRRARPHLQVDQRRRQLGADHTLPGDAATRVFSLAIHPSNGTVYAGTSSGIYQTANGRGNWTLSGLPGAAVRALAIDPLTPTTVYGGIDRDPGLVVTLSGG